jgi:hypothetical protein
MEKIGYEGWNGDKWLDASQLLEVGLVKECMRSAVMCLQ